MSESVGAKPGDRTSRLLDYLAGELPGMPLAAVVLVEFMEKETGERRLATLRTTGMTRWLEAGMLASATIDNQASLWPEDD